MAFIQNKYLYKKDLMKTLATILEEVKDLSLEEMEELQFVTEKYIIEKRRTDFHSSHKKSLKELKEGKLSFSSNIDELRASLD